MLDARPEHMEMLLRKIEAMGGVVDLAGRGRRGRGPGAPARVRRGDPALPRRRDRLQAADHDDAQRGRRRLGRHREPLRRAFSLRRRAGAPRREHHHRGPSRDDPRRRPPQRAPRCARATSAPRRPWSSPDSSPRARRPSTGLEHVERGYDDFVGRLARARCARRAGRRDPSTTPTSCSSAAREGSRTALARLLTYVESGGAPPAAHGRAGVPRAARPTSWASPGPPGAGKSTLTDRLITAAARRRLLRRRDAFAQVGVLCVDPSSPFTGGAILGDRIRMQDHATDERVFIRSMATRGHLGGLSLAVPDAIRVLGAAGFDLRPRRDRRGRPDGGRRSPSAADTTVVVTNPGLGRRDAGQQGRAPRGGRRLRHQQGRSRRRARDAPRPRTDARPAAPRAVAPADRRDGRDDGRGRRRPVAARRSTHRRTSSAGRLDERSAPSACARELDRCWPRCCARACAGLAARRGATTSRSTRCSTGATDPYRAARDTPGGGVIATSVAYDLVFLVHVVAAVAVLTVFVVMRSSASAVAAGARRRRPERARFPTGATGPRASLHLLPITGLVDVAHRRPARSR